jgi:TonB family protein
MLIIFFVLTTVFVRGTRDARRGPAVGLSAVPQGEKFHRAHRAKRLLLVVGRRKIAREDLAAAVTDAVAKSHDILVAGDRAARYGEVAETLELLRSLGVSEVSNATASARPAASKASGGGAVIDVSKLAVTKKISPEYPMISRKRKDEGTVTLIVTIKSGKVADVKVERGSGYPPLDESAIKAVHGWLFDSSAHEETITARIPFVFKLR